MTKPKHDLIAEYLAGKFNTEYKSDKGIDLVTKDKVIEVETKKEGLGQGISQIAHSSKARYLAVSERIVKLARELTEKSGIGIMKERGRIIKRAGRE